MTELVSQTTGEVVDLQGQPWAEIYERAAVALREAQTSAEVRGAEKLAKMAQHAAKLQHASVQSLGDCKLLLWDCRLFLNARIDEGQETGELAGHGGIRGNQYAKVPDSNLATLTEIGVHKKERHTWNEVSRAGGMAIVREVVNQSLEIDREPTDAEILRAAKRILNKQQNELEETLALPENTYRTIVIDPPWPMTKVEREVRPNQVGFEYPTMDLDAIAEMDVEAFAHADCHLFMWTTQKFLPPSLEILTRWGFTYVFTMVWHKPGGFQPHNLPQYNNEFCLYGRRGTPKFVETKSFSTCCQWPRREHSRKPDEFYALVERVTNGPRIDIFSREKRDGFEQWGNQPDHFEEVAAE